MLNFDIGSLVGWFEAYYFALSLQWGILWMMVGLHYGHASYCSWVAEGAGFKQALKDVFDPMIFAMRELLCRSKTVARLLGLDPNKTVVDIIPTNSPGNILRFSIFIASIMPMALGLGSAAYLLSGSHVLPVPERHEMLLSAFLVALSTLGALGHLFLANRATPKRWANTVLIMIIWMLIGPMLIQLWRTL